MVWPLEKGRIIRVPLHPVENELPEQASFSTRLIAWQKREGRHDLPWQQTRDPYRVWLSEIMLQQTQVATVIPYYQRFLSSFPDLAALAAAPIEAVVEHWAGLGYYARARNLLACARAVMRDHGGVFPATREGLLTLPGIGPWTAHYIAMRALRWPDAWPAGDIAMHHALGLAAPGTPGARKEAEQLSQRWRPWRSYALIRAWSAPPAHPPTQKTSP